MITATISEALGKFIAEHDLNLSTTEGTLKLAHTLIKHDVKLYGALYGLPAETCLDVMQDASRHANVLKQLEN